MSRFPGQRSIRSATSTPAEFDHCLSNDKSGFRARREEISSIFIFEPDGPAFIHRPVTAPDGG
ncbi:MAG: hypothetical protein HZA66_26120 [Rhodopseudomonas palustris]|uniref:Uncharacterized protein n=1 Tax=Rhodopseudomonas palustris TaxID=1076 RepID=A0A933S3E7_RHOPL|nr:hypothetical protein [Rhodopseudomonas palustris]